jgi:hypothetical protein
LPLQGTLLQQPASNPLQGTLLQQPSASNPLQGTLLQQPSASNPLQGTLLQPPASNPLQGTLLRPATSSPLQGTVIHPVSNSLLSSTAASTAATIGSGEARAALSSSAYAQPLPSARGSLPLPGTGLAIPGLAGSFNPAVAPLLTASTGPPQPVPMPGTGLTMHSAPLGLGAAFLASSTERALRQEADPTSGLLNGMTLGSGTLAQHASLNGPARGNMALAGLAGTGAASSDPLLSHELQVPPSLLFPPPLPPPPLFFLTSTSQQHLCFG